MWWSKKAEQPKPVRGLEELFPADPHDALVQDVYRTYPFGSEPYGKRALIRLVVYTVIQMKKRGAI